MGDTAGPGGLVRALRTIPMFPEVKAFGCCHRVKFDLFLRYGLIAAAGDRYLAEFMPPWYLKDPETVKSWGFGLTSVDWWEQDLQNRLDRSGRLVSGGGN